MKKKSYLIILCALIFAPSLNLKSQVEKSHFQPDVGITLLADYYFDHHANSTPPKTNLKAYDKTDDFAGGTGAIDDPFLVSNAFHLNNVRFYLNAYFLQTQDIDLNTEPWNEGEGWLPIGNVVNPFWGNYNGNGKAITGLFINRPTSNYIGLFGRTSGGAITNLHIQNSNITGNQRVGAISGQSTNI